MWIEKKLWHVLWRFRRILSFALAFVIIAASVPFLSSSSFADSPSETPVYLWIDYSNDSWASSTSARVELSDIISPNGQFKSIKIRQIDIPYTEGNIGQCVTVDFVVSGAIIGNVGETHNTGYIFQGGHFSNYYTTAQLCNKNYVQNFSDHRQFLDFQFQQNTTQLRQYYFSQVSYHVIANVQMLDTLSLLDNGIASIICTNPPTLTFWENSTSNIIPAYWVFKGYSSLNSNYSRILSLIHNGVTTIMANSASIVTQLGWIIEAIGPINNNLDFLTQRFPGLVDSVSNINDLQQEHQDMIDDWLDSGAVDALDNGKSAIEDSDGFGLLDDFSSGISSGPQFDMNNFGKIWESNGESTRWFSKACEDSLHDPGLNTRSINDSIIDFLSSDIDYINSALGVDSDD